MAERPLRSLTFERLQIPFTVAFRHASAERAETSSVLSRAAASSGATGFGESCPRPYVTNETLESADAFLSRHAEAIRDAVSDVASLRAWMTTNAEEIDANPAAWCALELALLDLFGVEQGVTIDALLSRPPLRGRYSYTAVVGDASPKAFEAAADQYRGFGFSDFKVKLSGDMERDRAKIAALRRWPSIRVRVDANNLWKSADEAIAFLRALEYRFFAVEEPLGPNQYQELARIADALACPIVLDESFLRVGQIAALADAAERWIVNVRVSKMGGLLRSLAVVDAASRERVRVIVGAQVGETSLLTRAALTVAHAAGDGLVAQEGAFGTRLLARDICDPPLMFGAGGVLDTAAFPALAMPGLGVSRSIRSA